MLLRAFSKDDMALGNFVEVMEISQFGPHFPFLIYHFSLISNETMEDEWETMERNIVTNLTRTLQSYRFWGGPIFYPIFKNGAIGNTPPPFLGGFQYFNFFDPQCFHIIFFKCLFFTYFQFSLL
jgi:hypothetical protein